MNTTPTVTRLARLFRAGEYSDKNAVFTAADLDAIVTRFEEAGGSVPLRLEHTETVFDPLGTVTNVYRRDAELLGAVHLPAILAAHLFAQNAPVHLSVNLRHGEGESGYRLVEVSLVREGRVDGAGFLDDAPTPAPTGDTGAASDAVAPVFARFRREGKLSPAMETPLRELLAASAGDTRFAASHAPALDALTRLLTALPVFRTVTPAPDGGALMVLASPMDEGNAAEPVSPMLASATPVGRVGGGRRSVFLKTVF